ncbi:hypothetical protein [Microseira sp. BLCC-F43]|jgi:hypothetical protein|uniref:hypothetical protein n=1 Tax=Microseira sp. BLCC-F43 TaxID=3153602 RepID=UPI0035B8F234
MKKSRRTQEQLSRNLTGFEGDSYIEEEIKKLVQKFEIKTIIETGTFLGGTTKKLAQIANQVYTIEVDSENIPEATEFLKDSTNVTVKEGSSSEILRDLLKRDHGNTLFYLDAHSHIDTPLLDELKAIAEAEIKPVVVIHDWKIPDRPDLGYDSYNGQDYTFEWIKPSIEAIYGNDYAYYYNNQAEGAKRGVIYIHSSS